MSTGDSGVLVGGGAPGGLNPATSAAGELIKIIKTQIYNHQSKPTILIGPTVNTTTPIAAKITHVKSLDACSTSGAITISGTSLTATPGGTIMTGVGGAIKVATASGVTTSLSGTPIALNNAQSTTAASIRAIGAGGQSTQVRVVMPSNIMPSMIKQLENAAAATGRTQITAIPASPSRTVSNTSITVTRPVAHATYLPRAGVNAAHMTGVGVAGGQRLVTPLRTTSTAAGLTPTVAGLSSAGNFVRGTAVSRQSVSQPTTVISSATSTTWMTANTSGQVQLIRTIPHQSRQRIITAQGLTTTGASGAINSGITSVTGGNINSNTVPVSGQSTANSTIQAVAASQATSHSQQQQQAYVATLATVLPPRQHQATLVYSSNVGGSQNSQQTLTQTQQFNPSVATGQRFAVATPLNAGSGGGTAAAGLSGPRQIRPIPLGKSFSTAKLNTTSISIRAPNIPQLTSTMPSGSPTTGGPAVVTATSRSSTVSGIAGSSTGNVLTTANLSTTRIIQLQQPSGGTTQQLIGSTGRLATNVMLQPIIVNTSGGGKIGIRPPVTMTAKVQPSLTITQLGIGKLPSTAGTSTSMGQQSVSASIQALSTGNNVSTSITGPSSVVASSGGTQLINVSQATSQQLLSSGNIVTSAASGVGSGATVVPLAITTRGTNAGILTGTITPIKNANGITVGKMMQQSSGGAVDASNVGAQVTQQPPNVFIHQRPSNNSGSLVSSSANIAAVSAANSAATSSASAFLTAGSTIYYESMPASTVQVSTGVLSLTTTTLTNSTMTQPQMVSTGGGLAISSLPFVTHTAGSGASSATFTVVPSGGRTLGQLQLPVSNAGTQLQAIPLRFSTTQSVGGVGVGATTTDITTATQLVQAAASGQQLIIPGAQQSQQHQQHHMVIPLQTSVKVTTCNASGVTGVPGSAGVTSAAVSNLLRKRDSEGSPIRAAKNLAPTLISMGGGHAGVSTTITSSGSPASSSVSSSYSIVSASSANSQPSALTAETLAKKDRAANAPASSTRSSRADSPASSDGSTTVSANSSPGVDQQIQDNNSMVINRMSDRTSDTTHFNPINELYSSHHSNNMGHNLLTHNLVAHNTSVSSRQSVDLQQQLQQNVAHAPQQPQQQQQQQQQQRLNGGAYESSSRKRSRRSTNDSNHSTQSQASLSLPPPTGSAISNSNNSVNSTSIDTGSFVQNNGLLMTGAPTTQTPSENNTVVNNNNNNNNTNNHRVNHVQPIVNNKENAKPTEYLLKRPRNCSLLNNYKQSWKPANNHFQRYSDVKPREDRRPTVIDLANQANVLGKINGWKIYHLRSQMEDLCENEAISYDKLESMLADLEKDQEKNPEIERISELLKGNMQRSKIIVDGINEAQSQIMKVFDHKSHISDIIHRCASKRNFKKREKM